jgi:hypothetical protein
MVGRVTGHPGEIKNKTHLQGRRLWRANDGHPETTSIVVLEDCAAEVAEVILEDLYGTDGVQQRQQQA